MAKYLLIAAIVISLVTAGLGFKNQSTLAETKATLAETQGTLATSQKSLTGTQLDLKNTKASLETALSDKEKLAADLSAANADLSTTKASLDAATKTVAQSQAKITDLEAQIASIPTGGTGGGGIEELKKRVDELNQQVTEQTAQITSLSDKNKADVATIADYKKKDEDRINGEVQQGLEGRVLAVNPAWNFVVLSIGDKQGVTNNAELLIKRSGQYLGKVRITSVEPSTSIADIVANTMPAGVAVQPGDSVIFQSKE